jgi:hypothetical protein
MADYAACYRNREQPLMDDDEFHPADDFVTRLHGFGHRFGGGS